MDQYIHVLMYFNTLQSIATHIRLSIDIAINGTKDTFQEYGNVTYMQGCENALE
jgi:hypothetical protein